MQEYEYICTYAVERETFLIMGEHFIHHITFESVGCILKL